MDTKEQDTLAMEQAINDMVPELYKTGKCFIAFIVELNPVMEELVNQHIKEQELKNKNNGKI